MAYEENVLSQILKQHGNVAKSNKIIKTTETEAGARITMRAMLLALLGVSLSACAFATQPVELELEDDEVVQRLNNVSFARRITKPTIRYVVGSGKLGAFVTVVTSLLLLIAVMSKKSWWRHDVRWLAAPALLVTALEAASDIGDTMLNAILRGPSEPLLVVGNTLAALLMITVEILVWYFIAKFFEYEQLPSENQGDIAKTPSPSLSN